jgi:hypothetical protein
MVFCENCGENVLPNTYFTWKGFILGLGIFYLIYIITKIPQCPNCNFPMPRRNMVFAVQSPQNLIKLTSIGALQLTHLKDSLTSVSRRSSQDHKFNPSQHLTCMNTHKAASFNMMVNEVHNTISLKGYESKGNIGSGDNL